MFISPGSRAQRKRPTGMAILLDSISGSFNGATTTFNLTQSAAAVSPGTPQNLIVVLGGVVQTPNSAYTVSGSTITFSSAPYSIDTCTITMLGPLSAVGGGGGTASVAGANTQIQYNTSGALGGDANLTWNFTTLTIGNSTVNSYMNSTSQYAGAINSTAIGSIYANNYVMVGNSSINATMNASTHSTSGPNYTIISTTTTAIPLTVTGAASATANLFSVGNNTTAAQFVINSTGYAICNGAGITTILSANGLNAGLTTKSFDVLSPIAGDSYTIFWTNAAITIAEIVIVIQGTTTPWANVNFYSGTSRAAVSATINATANVTNVTTGIHMTNFTTAAVAANSFVWANIGGVGNTTEVHATIKF